MDQFNPKDEAADLKALSDSPDEQKRALPPPPTPTNFYKEFVQFAIFLGVVLIPLYTSFDYMADGLQAFISDYIVPYRDPNAPGTVHHTIDKNIARTIVFALLFAGFTSIFFIRHSFLSRARRAQQDDSDLAVVDQTLLRKKDQEINELREKTKTNMRVLRTIHNQLYHESTPRLDFNSLRGTYHVNASGDLRAHKFISVRADKNEGHFWTFYAVGDEHSQRLERIEDLNFQVSASDEDTDLLPIATVDEELKKQFAIYFLPLLQPGETRLFSLYYEWPGSFLKLLQTGTASFDWTNRAATSGKTGDFYAEWIFDEAFGSVECKITGSKPSGLHLSSISDAPPSKWILEGERVAMGNIPYELTFFAKQKNEKS